jgi:GNAT superfamily N-acetyltransferase
MSKSNQQSLEQFGVDTEVDPRHQLRADTIPQISDIIDNITPYNPPKKKDHLPDISGYSWKHLEQYRQLSTVPLWRPDGGGINNGEQWENPEEITPDGRIIVSTDHNVQLREFLSDHGIACIEFPPYYTQLPDMEEEYRWSIDGHILIHGHWLKRALRLANGSGRISSDSRAILCDTGDIVITGSRGVFIAPIPSTRNSIVRNKQIPDPPKEVHHTLYDSISVPEESPKMRKSLNRYFQLRDQSPYPSIVDYNEFKKDGRSLKHQFTTSNGNTLSITQNELNIISGQTAPLDEVNTLHVETQRFGGDSGEKRLLTVLPSDDDFPGMMIGEEVTIVNESNCWEEKIETNQGIITGYRTYWRPKERMNTGGRKDAIGWELILRVGLLNQHSVTVHRGILGSFGKYVEEPEPEPIHTVELSDKFSGEIQAGPIGTVGVIEGTPGTLQDIQIDEKFRGNGLAKAAIAEFEAQCQRTSVSEITTTAVVSQAMEHILLNRGYEYRDDKNHMVKQIVN